MRILYGDLEFKMVLVNRLGFTPKMSSNGSTFLWNHWTVDMVCQFNPAQTAYQLDANGNPVVRQVNATITIQALKNYMAQPRRILQVLGDDGTIILQAPKNGDTVDQDNGPECEACIVESVHGDRTYQVHLIFTADVNDCTEGHVLLAHHWSRGVDVDKDYLATVTTEGECVFNNPVLTNAGQYADQFRAALFHPIPDNFQRENIRVTPDPDGYTYRYSFTDREKMYNLGQNCPVNRIECYLTGWGSQKGKVSSGIQAVEDFFTGDPLGAARDAMMLGIPIVIRAIRKPLPEYSLAVQVRVWGSAFSTRDQLRDLALGVMAYQLRFATGPCSDEFILIEDRAARFVEINKTVSWGIEDFFRVFGGNIIAPDGSFPRVVDMFRDGAKLSLALDGTTKRNPVASNFSGNWTGTSNIALIQQALSSPCGLPGKPPANTESQNLNQNDIT